MNAPTTASAANNYLDPATLAQIGSLELRARMVADGMMTGMHRSPHQGFSVEFAQHRQYAPGDDLRHLDWKVYARTDKLYIKQYQRETNLDLVLLLDASGSMGFSSDTVRGWRKYDYAASVAAALAYLALKQTDRVGLAVFDERIRQDIRASNAKDHWKSLTEALATETLPPGEAAATGRGTAAALEHTRQTNLGQLFDLLSAKLRQRSLIVLLSDLFDDPASVERGLARLRHRRHDVMVLQILDHAELEFPYRSAMEFVGLEGEGRLPLDPLALRQAYKQALDEHVDTISRTVRRFGFDHLLLDSSESLGGPLSHLLAWRAASVSRGKQT